MIDPYPFNFYSFACSVHPLASLSGGAEFRGNSDLVSLFNDANIIADYFRLHPFCVIHLSSAGRKLRGIQEIVKSYLYIQPPENKPMPETVSSLDAERLKELVQEFETILSDEVSKLPIFCLEDEKIGNFSIKKLLKGASNGYPDKTRDCLTPSCKAEIDEAGKCLVYERSTASGFHILRSVELTIRQYLLACPGFVMPPLNRQNWGEYLQLLKDNGATKDVTDHLHNIKDNYRNPLMHPEDTLEMDEAVSLFGVAQSMNEMLVADMKKRGLIQCQIQSLPSSTP